MNLTDDCIEWDGQTNYGYGIAGGRAKGRVHRLAWAEAHGPIPDGMCVLHRCDNPPCFNVDHLFLGTHADNVADKTSKGRQAKGSGHGNAKLSEADVNDIRKRARLSDRGSCARLAREYGVGKTLISTIIHGFGWRHA